jgi:hypothetical protein
MPSIYKATTEGEVALAAAGTTKSILGIAGNANFGMELKEIWVDFDGVDATNKPVRIIIARSTFATNAPGTASTSVTVIQSRGRHAATGFSAAKNWTTEPTVITAEEDFSLDPNKGIYRYAWPLGEEPDTVLGSGWVIQALVETGDTVAAAIRAGMRVTRT